MDIQLTEQRLFALGERLSYEDIRVRAMDKRTTAFGGGIGGLLQRPKAEDVNLVATQRRVEPFWHVSCRARYVYDRTREYAIPASAADVRSVTVAGGDHQVGPTAKGAGFVIPVLEHCLDEFSDELYIDGVGGTAMSDGLALTTGPSTEVGDPAALAADETLVVPPEHRASSVVRQLLAKMMRPLQADAVLEESLALEHIDLYYRPIFAYEFHWVPKDKRGVVEIDGLTGQVHHASSLRTQLSRMVTRDALFDIGADTIGLLVPGGSIAVKVARVALDKSY